MGKNFTGDDVEMGTPSKGAPLKMAVEIGKLADLTNMLLRTVNASSQPSGRRSGSGADVGIVVRQIVKQNQRVKEAEGKMKEHQELQGIVRAKANEFVKAEKALARCIKDFGDIEARLSHVLHDVAARHSVSGESDYTQTGGRSC